MNARTMIVGALAVVCGLSAMFLVQAIRRPPSGPVIEKVPAVYASADVKPGETISEAMLEVREVPKAEVPEDAILKLSDAIDRAAMTPIDKGDLLRSKKLAERGAGRGMAALIRSGMRAITIPTPSVSTSMAGFLLPGNRVDILLTTSSSGGSADLSGGATTMTLLENVEILAVHTNVNAPTSNKIDPEQARSVTVQVTPDDANRLQLAQAKGTLHLSLRNLKDTEDGESRPATLADIQDLKLKPAPPPVATAPEPPKPSPAGSGSGSGPGPEGVRDLARSIRPGMRAFTVTTPSHARSLVKTIRVGHRVDVLLTVNLKEDNKLAAGNDPGQEQGAFRGVCSTLLQDQEVLEIHPTLDTNSPGSGSPDEIRAITLLVTPRDAQMLDLAESAGKLHLTLCPEDAGYGAAADPRPAPVTNADLMGDRRPVDPTPAMITLEVRTLRGTAAGANSLTYPSPGSTRGREADPPPKRAPSPRPRASQGEQVAGAGGRPASP